ncbi:aminoglycoside phosphotransferase [Chondrocystis sp. NIES-4102]|nr:aminoglycoside phosphotransferase [Chondrocystis sp. NIES-4102]
MADKSPSLREVAGQFSINSTIIDIQPYGNGNINNTFLVQLDNQPSFILQSLNTTVFSQPELVMNNICILLDYIKQKLSNSQDDRPWLMPQVLLTPQQQHHYLGEDGSFWRAMSFIPNSQSFDTIKNIQHGQEIGYALGKFHYLINDLPIEKLADTLVGFHITPGYLKHYQQVVANSNCNSSPEVNYCHKFISDRPDLPYILETAKETGTLPQRIIHGDPKINNIMLDCQTQQAVAMIDLDTVKPGLIHYDLGDCLRSGCNLLSEETENWEQVTFEPELAQAIMQGYLAVSQDFLTVNDYQYIYPAIRLLAFELGLRFFTDYLAGNIYFKVAHPEHNLARALVQFKLTASIEQQSRLIKQIIQDLT